MYRIASFIKKSFVPYLTEIKQCQIRVNKYFSKDMFRLKVLLTQDRVGSRDKIKIGIKPLIGAKSSDISYWFNKFTKIGIYDQMFMNSRNIIHPTGKGRILAADGSVICTRIFNKHGVGKASLTVCALLDIKTHLFHEYAIADDCNEHTSLVNQAKTCTIDDIIIADRNYGKYSLLSQLYDNVGFLVRISKNMNIYKSFIKSSEHTRIIEHVHNGKKMRLKLIKYVISKKTRKRVKVYMSDMNQISDEDDESVFVLCTNVLDMSEETAQQLYRDRWKIETGFRYLKSNFDVRNPMKAGNCNSITDHIKYTIGLSFVMYNITQNIKLVRDSDNVRKCRFSGCADQVRYMLDQIIQNPSLLNITEQITRMMKRLIMHKVGKPKLICNGNHDKKRGRYKSKKTIEGLNNTEVEYG